MTTHEIAKCALSPITGRTIAYAFAIISPASLKCVFRAFLILQLTTLYSGHMASESLTLARPMYYEGKDGRACDDAEHDLLEVEGAAEDAGAHRPVSLRPKPWPVTLVF